MRIITVLLAALVWCGSAAAWTSEPELAAVASRIAGHPVDARCYQRDEAGDPWGMGAWGYVWTTDDDAVHLATEVCEGALAVSDPVSPVPLWKQGLGVLVLTHEAYHLARRYPDRRSEAATECRAVRHARYATGFLGGEARWENIKVAVLAVHYLLLSYAPQYALEDCKTPGWWS